MKLKNISEESINDISKIIQHIDKDRVAGVISACRQELTPEENASRTAELSATLDSNGFSHIKIKGRFHEWWADEATVEESFVVSLPGTVKNYQELSRFLINMMKRYDQDAIILKPAGWKKALMYWSNGNISPIGEIETQKLLKVETMRQGMLTQCD